MARGKRRHPRLPGEEDQDLGSEFSRRPFQVEITEPSEPEPKRPLTFLAGYSQLLENWALLWDEELALGIISSRWMISTWQTLPKLRGFWPLSSSDGQYGSFYDLSGQGRTLSNRGGVGIISENYISAANFGGTASSDSLYRLDETAINWNGLAEGVTILAYVYPSSSMSGTWGPIVCKGTAALGIEYALRVDLSNDEVRFDIGNMYGSGLSVRNNRWNFIAFSYDRTYDSARLQVDEEILPFAMPSPTLTALPGAGLDIGEWNGGAGSIEDWQGRLAMVAILDGVIPTQAVSNAFEATRHAFEV